MSKRAHNVDAAHLRIVALLEISGLLEGFSGADH